METNEAHRPDLRTEFIAGVTTFFTMAYIVVVNPSILSTEGTGIPFSGALTATVVVCFVMTMLMGVYARLPFAVAPGMGLISGRAREVGAVMYAFALVSVGLLLLERFA